MKNIKSQKAYNDWLKQLKTYRQAWPEWDQLEKLVKNLSFDIVEEYYTETDYLVSDLIEDKFYLVYKVPTTEYKDFKNKFEKNPEIFPTYFIPLLDLKLIEPYGTEKAKETKEGVVLYSGGIGGSLSYEEITWIQEENETGGALGLYPNPWKGSIPKEHKLFRLQSTISGTDFFCSTEKKVYILENSNEKYLPIGTLDNFIRWCLRMILEKKNWHNAYFDKLYFDEYNLSYQDTWMD